LGIIDESENESSNKTVEFSNPRGLTVNNKFIYVCDYDNHRIQLLIKEKGIFFFDQWGNGVESIEFGQFWNPNCIYKEEDEGETLFYIGDRCSVQLFRGKGVCIQRIGDKVTGKGMNQFRFVFSICVLENHLYVGDFGNDRIQIFRRTTE